MDQSAPNQIDVEENVKQLERAVEEGYKELYRLQGMLRVFGSLKELGFTKIDIPKKREEEDVSDAKK